MAIHTHSNDVFRLDVVESGRRRRWSKAKKLRIVAESASGPQLVSATVRRHGLSRSQLFTWRRALPPRIEIVLRGSRRLIVEGPLDTAVTLELAQRLEPLR